MLKCNAFLQIYFNNFKQHRICTELITLCKYKSCVHQGTFKFKKFSKLCGEISSQAWEGKGQQANENHHSISYAMLMWTFSTNASSSQGQWYLTPYPITLGAILQGLDGAITYIPLLNKMTVYLHYYVFSKIVTGSCTKRPTFVLSCAFSTELLLLMKILISQLFANKMS